MGAWTDEGWGEGPDVCYSTYNNKVNGGVYARIVFYHHTPDTCEVYVKFDDDKGNVLWETEDTIPRALAEQILNLNREE